MAKATVGIAGLLAVVGLACGSSLPSGGQADGEGIGGNAGTGAGAAGSGGTSAIGGAGGCDLPATALDVVCASTYAEQDMRNHCGTGDVVYGGTCDGQMIQISVPAAGTRVWCLYNGDGTALVGARVCSDARACNGPPRCVAMGVNPSPYPGDPPESCAANRTLATRCGCSAPEVFSPGACSPTYAEQITRTTCVAGHPITTGFCAGYRYTFQNAPWIMDILDGYRITCVYQPDGVGQLVGERIGTTDPNVGCPLAGGGAYIHTSGFVPLDMNTDTCPADAGTSGNPAVVCTADGGAPG